jgi:hypothetical protein
MRRRERGGWDRGWRVGCSPKYGSAFDETPTRWAERVNEKEPRRGDQELETMVRMTAKRCCEEFSRG